MLFAEGSLELILDSCTDYWDGEGVKELDSVVFAFSLSQC